MNIINKLKIYIEYKVKHYALMYLDVYPYRRYMTKNNCVFIHIPKAAGTSVLQTLAGTDGFIPRDHSTIEEFKIASTPLLNDFFSFTIVRNPLDRIDSVYRYLKKGGNGTNDLELSKFINSNFPTLNDYILEYLDKDIIHAYKLTKPQYTFVCDEKYKVLVDFVGRFESINEDFSQISKKLNLKRELPHSNKSEVMPLAISEEAKEKIKNLYSVDYQVFYPDLL